LLIEAHEADGHPVIKTEHELAIDAQREIDATVRGIKLENPERPHAAPIANERSDTPKPSPSKPEPPQKSLIATHRSRRMPEESHAPDRHHQAGSAPRATSEPAPKRATTTAKPSTDSNSKPVDQPTIKPVTPSAPEPISEPPVSIKPIVKTEPAKPVAVVAAKTEHQLQPGEIFVDEDGNVVQG
jgi:cell division protein FtsN